MDSKNNNAPGTEDEILAATVGEREPLNSTIYLAPYDPVWPSMFTTLKRQVQDALRAKVRLLELVRTSVL